MGRSVQYLPRPYPTRWARTLDHSYDGTERLLSCQLNSYVTVTTYHNRLNWKNWVCARGPRRTEQTKGNPVGRGHGEKEFFRAAGVGVSVGMSGRGIWEETRRAARAGVLGCRSDNGRC